MPDYSLGPRVEGTDHYALLRHTLTYTREGVAVEFGVGQGTSTRILAQHMPTIGFDSWMGLPEHWRPEYPAGSFAAMPPTIPNTTLVDGWYEDSLPDFDFNQVGPIALVHIDCDLYSSTKTALRYVGPSLLPGAVLVFDEWHGYDTCELHEQKAFREYADKTGLSWTVLGHGHEAWAIQIGHR